MVPPHVKAAGRFPSPDNATPLWNGSGNEPERLGRLTRGVLGAGALALVVGFALAAWLEPDPSGRGTHRRLGLPPCTFLAATGQPCPTCGMTTAFAWFVRGRLDRSWQANPAGCLLAPACAALVPWLLISAVRGRPAGFRTFDQPLSLLVVAAVAICLVSWTVRVLLWRELR